MVTRLFFVVMMLAIFSGCYTQLQDSPPVREPVERPPSIYAASTMPAEEIRRVNRNIEIIPGRRSEVQLQLYETGDYIEPEVVRVTFDGEVSRYRVTREGMVLLKRRPIDNQRVAALFERYQFSEYRWRIPDTRALNRWPARQVVISWRPAPEMPLKNVQVHMSARDHFYPRGFKKFFRSLERRLERALDR